ncbi:Arabinogalactan peptide 16 [Hibiscus syriacus]|uniref:Arabinogalactan peptide 16 n=1 Tax=Hibiscus syriacus TaxID=106335 RepID=A0A6A3AMN0_HIBSY|nr:Arabinogalactan peptide 16 [Hibiscus syriacus]
MSSMKFHVVPAAIGLVLLALVQLSYEQAMGSPPAPAPSSDGAAIDQGIAYFLLLLALAVTYLVH